MRVWAQHQLGASAPGAIHCSELIRSICFIKYLLIFYVWFECAGCPPSAPLAPIFHPFLPYSAAPVVDMNGPPQWAPLFSAFRIGPANGEAQEKTGGKEIRHQAGDLSCLKFSTPVGWPSP